MEKISWTDHVRNEEELHRVKDETNILHTIKTWKANRIGRILHRNSLVKHTNEGKIKEGTEAKGRQRRRRKYLLDNLKKTRGSRKLKEAAPVRPLWRTGLGTGYGPVVRHNAINE